MSTLTASLFSAAFHAYVRRRFDARCNLLAPLLPTIDRGIAGLDDPDEAVLVRYYYATMPATDVFDSPFELYASFAHQACELRRTSPWSRDIPEDLFIHYVASPRVNNEPLTDCWPTFRAALADRLRGRDAYDAVRETDYWCAEVATYQTTDIRTLGPLGVLASGNGRCGEESTFLVTALRANGIPARQLYTPWWAHCDDNHAWVEAYTGDGWHYLGACEPEDMLDRGWFTAASGRALLVHTRLFSDYGCNFVADASTLAREGSQVIVNLTERYAPVVTLGIDVKQADGTPAAGVSVRLQLINEAAWRDMAHLMTDANGHAEIVVGEGTMRATASVGELMAEAPVDTNEQTSVQLTLTPLDAFTATMADGSWRMIDVHAPADHPAPCATLTPEQAEHGRARKREADRMRTERVASFAAAAAERAANLPDGLGTNEQVRSFFAHAFDNAPELERFLTVDDGVDRIQLLGTLTTKDFRDLTAATLEDHIAGARSVREQALVYLAEQGAVGTQAEELYVRYVLNPRAYFEQLTPYRAFIAGAFDGDAIAAFCADPMAVWRYVQETTDFTATENIRKLVGSPQGCLTSRQAGPASQRALFVAICRTFGIAARINPVDQMPEYYANGSFVAVERPVATRPVHFASDAEPAPGYYQAWSVARLDSSVSVAGVRTRGYEELDFLGTRFENGACTLPLADGQYRLITATRLPNGDVQAAERAFCVDDGLDAGAEGSPERPIALTIRQPDVSDMLEDIALDAFAVADAADAPVEPSALALAHTDPMHPVIVSFLEPGMEPTEHLLNEMRDQADRLAAAGVPILLGLRDAEELADPTLSRTLPALQNVTIGFDDFSEQPERLARRMFANPEKLPLTMLITVREDGAMTGRYATAGYNVGTIDLLLKLLEFVA